MSRQIRFSFCQSSFLYNSIQSYREQILILDTRDYDHFDTHAISGSISVSPGGISEYLKSKNDSKVTNLKEVTPELLAETMSEKELDRYNQRRRIFCFLIVSERRFPEELLFKLKKLTGADEFVDFFDVSQKHIDDDLKSAVQQMEEHGPVTFGLQLFETLQKDRVRELFILIDGANAFFERYPYMDPSYHPSANDFVRSKSLMAAKLDVTYNYPNDILNNRLFLGSFNQASQDIIVNGLGTTHIINVTAECKNVYEEKGIHYLHIIILDETQVTLSIFFKQVYDFIENALNENETNKVLLHCAMGKSRSATMTVMYLMKKYGWGFDKALTYVKMKRKVVDPNYGFLRQLEEFEKGGLVFLE